MSPDSLTWRLLDGRPVKSVTGLNGKATEGNGLLMYPVGDLAVFLLEEVNKQPSATVLFNHKVVSVDQNESTAWVDIESGGRFEADFVVGCDGASSSVRKALFGGSFPGKTWDKIFVGANVMLATRSLNWIHADVTRYFTTLRNSTGRTFRWLFTQSTSPTFAI
jgi:2-polyprenyl-6-methoxyphenol hydroxylase-like FAD-dependent oxidoreductase